MRFIRTALLGLLVCAAATYSHAVCCTLVNTANSGHILSPGVNTLATAAQNVTAGNGLFCFVRYVDTGDSVRISGVTDTAGDTFSQITPIVRNATSGDILELWYTLSSGGNASNVTTVTYTLNDPSFETVSCEQWSGLPSGSTFDVTTSQITTGTSITSPSFSTSQTTELVLAGLDGASTSGSWTAGSIGANTSTIGTGVFGTNGVALETENTTFSAAQAGITAAASQSAGSVLQLMMVAGFGKGGTARVKHRSRIY